MEKIEKQELITLDDGKEFLVVDIVEYEGERYLYLARDDEKLEVMLVKEKIEADELVVETVGDNDIKKIIMEKLLENNH